MTNKVTTTAKALSVGTFLVESEDDLPAKGSIGVIYLTRDTGIFRRWDGYQYIVISGSGNANQTIPRVFQFSNVSDLPAIGAETTLYINDNENTLYRWDGKNYVVITGDGSSTESVSIVNNIIDLPTIGVNGIIYVVREDYSIRIWNNNIYIVLNAPIDVKNNFEYYSNNTMAWDKFISYETDKTIINFRETNLEIRKTINYSDTGNVLSITITGDIDGEDLSKIIDYNNADDIDEITGIRYI